MDRASLAERIWYESFVPVFIEKVLLPIGALSVGIIIWTNPMRFDWWQRGSLGLAVLLFLFFLAYTLHLRNEAIRAGHPGNASTSQPPPVPMATPSPTHSMPSNPPRETMTPPKQQPVHIEQHSEGPNSPNIVGNVTVNPPVNPYAPVVTYDFNGTKRKTSPGVFRAEAGEEMNFFSKTMVPLQEQQRWRELQDACEKQIIKTPEWLTPYLYSGVALANLGEKTKAIERLRYLEKTAGGNPDYSDAKRLLGILEGH